MKNNDLTQTQTVTEEKTVIAENTEKAQELINKAEQAKNKKDNKKPEPKQRPTSMEAMAEKLLKQKASKETISKAFTAAYKVKGKTDKVFIAKRIEIYMKIAEKRANKK